MKNIDKVLIPSGPSDEIDIQRARGAIDIFGPDFNYVILGVGPDIYKALEYFEGNKEVPTNLDHHLAMYKFVISKIDKDKLELITTSTTAVQNFLEFFKNQRAGNYVIVSDAWQLKKYKHIFNKLRNKGKISKEANLDTFPIQTDKYYNLINKLASQLKTESELFKI